VIIYHDLSGAYGIYEEALQKIRKDNELKKKVWGELVKHADDIKHYDYDDGRIYCIEISEKNIMKVNEIREIVSMLKKFEKRGGKVCNGFRVVAKVYRFVNYYIIEDEYYDDYYLVSDIIDFMKDERTRKLVTSHQRIKKIINNTIFLWSGKTVRFWGIKYGKKVIEKLRMKTKNGLLEATVSLGEGADIEDNKIFYDIEEVEYYEEFSKEAKVEGIPCGLGFGGHAFGILVCKKENGRRVIMLEEVVSYSEGYSVSRKILDEELINIIRSEKFEKEVLSMLKKKIGGENEQKRAS